MAIRWITKNQDSPRGKPRVYFSSCDQDFSKYFKKITDQLFAVCDCAVYYYPPGSKVDTEGEYPFELGRVDLMVIPVTTRLFSKPCRTMDFDVGYGTKMQIPILPLIQEEGLETEFNRRFGNLQFLKEDTQDRTVIPYEEKLKTFVRSVLTGDELAQQIRAAFCARIFLSYRKKDRAHAQQLMGLIHENALLRDVAIWYDEFLVPGDNFNQSILKELQQSNLFVMAVTPNLLEPDNYVMTEEYPAACKVLPVVPAELVRTDRQMLKQCYPGIHDPIDAYDETVRSGILQALLRNKLEQKEDPQHLYLMGVAYLSGIDVEKNPERALVLLQSAARGKNERAAEKLANIYHMGDRVVPDHDKAKLWLREYTEITRERFETQRDEESTFSHYQALVKAGVLCEDSRDHRAALDYYNRAIPLAELLCQKFDHSRKLLADCYRNVGQIYDDCDDYAKGLAYMKKATEIFEGVYENQPTGKNCRYMADCYLELADAYEEMEQFREAVNCAAKAAALLNGMLEADPEDRLYLQLNTLYDKIGDYYVRLGDKTRAKACDKQAQTLIREYEKKSQSNSYEWYMAAGRYYFKRKKMFRAIGFLKKALALAKDEAENDTIHKRLQLGLGYSMLGLAWAALPWNAKARQNSRKAVEIFRCVGEEYPFCDANQLLADEYVNLGAAYDMTDIVDDNDALYSDFSMSAKGKRDAQTALGHYTAALQLLEQLVEDRTLADYKKRKAEILEAIGRVNSALGKKEEAIDCFVDYWDLCMELYEQNPTDMGRDRFAGACFKLGILTRRRDLMEEAYRHWDRLCRKYPEDPALKKKKKEAQWLLK